MKKIFLLSTIIFCFFYLAIAQPGQLDPTFGTNGIVRTDLGKDYAYSSSPAKKILLLPDGSMYVVQGYLLKRHADGSADESFGINGSTRDTGVNFNSAAIQADGKIVVAGVGNINYRYSDVSQSDFAVARYNTDGSLDKTFAGDGIQTTDFGAPNANFSPDEAYSIAIQKDGKIVVAGLVADTISYQRPALVRYNKDGSLDSTFDGDGKLINDEMPGTLLAIEEDGKIVVAGSKNGDFVVVRYNIDGSLDHSFGKDGIQTTDFGPMPAGIASLAIQSDGKIIAGGSITTNSNYYPQNFALARYNTDGSLDKSFSDDGKLTTDVGNSYGLKAIALQNDGKIVAAGDSSGNAFLLVRYDVNGNLDKSFSNDGKQVTPFGISTYGTQAFSIAIQTNGKIVAGGSASLYFAIARYNNDGSLDKTFDKDGKLTDGIRAKNTIFNSTVVQNDGKIIAAGRTWNGNNFDFAIVRYNTDGSLDKTFAEDGVQITDFDSTDDYANSAAIQSDGKIVVAGYSGSSDSNRFSIVRYNTDGTLDNTFDHDGKLQDDFGSKINRAYSVAIQSDNKIVVAGDAEVKDNYGYYITNFAIARYNTDGSTDKTFDQDGKQIVAWQDEGGEDTNGYATSVAIQSDGKIVVAGINPGYYAFSSFAILNTDGSIGKQGSLTSDAQSCSLAIQKDGKIVLESYFNYRGDDGIEIYRTNADGSLDSSFNKTGYVRTQFEFMSTDKVNSVAIQNDNKIVVAGTKLYRYNTNGSIDSTFGSNGIQTAAFNINSTGISGNRLYAAGGGNYGYVAKYLLNGNNNPPTVTLTTPTNNTTRLAPAAYIRLSAAASDADGTISKVEFYNGTKLLHTETVVPYGFVWRNVPVGNYTLTAKAYDNSGNVTTSAPVHISIVPNQPPTVSIIKPLLKQTVAAPGYIYFEAAASDSDGRITRVEFYNGSTWLNTQYQYPYTFVWKDVPVGTYTITAIATDNWGANTTSAPVTVRVVSPIVSAKASSVYDKTALNNIVSMKLSPNPATDIVNIYTTGLQQDKPATLSVISASGVVMKTIQTNSSAKTVQLDVSSLISGVYTIKMISGDKVMYKQFVKL